MYTNIISSVLTLNRQLYRFLESIKLENIAYKIADISHL